MIGGVARLFDDLGQALGCPYCQGGLRIAEDDRLDCTACGVSFPFRGSVPVLLRSEDVAAWTAFERGYRQARLQEGLQPLSRNEILALPFCSPPGYPLLYWQVRRQSYRRLMRFLAQVGPSPSDGPVADLGAGMGWLSFRLARVGYRALAVDVSLDRTFGLGAAAPYVAASDGHLSLAQGDLGHPPLRQESWSLVVFNASLHYAHDLEATLRRAARALRPGGCVIVLDTPIARSPVSGTGRGDRHLGRRELHQALCAAGLHPHWLSVRRNPRWWIYRAKAWLKGDSPFCFPMVAAQRGLGERLP